MNWRNYIHPSWWEWYNRYCERRFWRSIPRTTTTVGVPYTNEPGQVFEYNPEANAITQVIQKHHEINRDYVRKQLDYKNKIDTLEDLEELQRDALSHHPELEAYHESTEG